MPTHLFLVFISISRAATLMLAWILPTLIADGGGEDDYVVPPGVEVRQVVPQLEATSINYRYDGNHVTDNEEVSVVLAGNDVVALNVADGTVKVRATLPVVPPSLSTVYLKTEGGILYLAYKEPVWSNNKERITLRALDLTTGDWLWVQTVDVTEKWKSVNGGGGGASIALHAGEIRVIFTDGQMARWRLSDLTSLPTYYFDSGSPSDIEKDSIGPGPSRTIGVSIGDQFCAGISDYGVGLVMVNAGKSSVRKYSLNYLQYGPAYASSRSYLVTRVSGETYPGHGHHEFLVWNLRKPKDAPIFTAQIKYDAGLPGVNLKIWKDRFLLASIKNGGSSPGGTLLVVYDLASPGQAPLKIQFPAGLPDMVDMGINDGDFWFLTDLKPAAVGWVRGVAASTTMAAVRVDDARAAEADGSLSFKVHVDGRFTSPVTVHLKSRSGSAKEGIDYGSYDQTLTFTPDKPSTVVEIPILQDTDLEAYESMILEVVGVNHAWRANRFANGTIFGGGLAKIETLSAPPGGDEYFEFSDWAMTPEGVVAGISDGQWVYRYYLKRLGAANWEEISSLTGGPSYYSHYSRIVAVRGNRVCTIVYGEDPQDPSETKLVVADVGTNLRIATISTSDEKAAMNDGTLVTLSSSNTLRGYDLESGNLAWGANVNRSSGLAGWDDTSFICDGEAQTVVVRSYANGSILRSLSKPLGGISVLATGDGGVTTFLQNGMRVIGNPGPDGHPYWMFPEPYSSSGGLISEGLAVVDDASAPGVNFKFLDCATGAVLEQMGARRTTQFGAQGGRFGLVLETGKLTIFRNHSVVPGPLQNQVTRKEGEDPSTWKITLAETAAFPVTVRLLSGGDDVQATDPVTIPAGSLSAAFPATVMKDGIPEYDETIPMEIGISGNGSEAFYQINVTIPHNEYEVIPQLKGGNLLEGGSSVEAHPTGIVIGTTRGAAAADPIYEKIYHSPKGLVGYGFAVACNQSFMATSAVDLPELRGSLAPSVSQVFLYNRKSGKRLATLVEATNGSALGAVLHMDSAHLFAGAPGRNIPGSVLVYDFKTKKSKTFKEPGAKNAKSRFGASITSSGDQMWIGAPQASAGKVYQFNVATGKLVRVLTPPDGGRANFGTALEILGSKLMVGAPNPKNGAAVFSFSLNTGKLAATIPGPFADGGNFGASLAVPRNDVLAVGCPSSLFAPEGGALLYDFPSGKAHLITMLCSSKNTDRPAGGTVGYLGGMGAVGGMAGTGSLLVVAADVRRSPVEILGLPPLYDSYPRVGLISLLKYLPEASKPTSLAIADMQVSRDSSNAWETVLGEGASAEDCKIQVRAFGGSVNLTLPEIAGLADGCRLTVERSEDMNLWSSVATLDSKNTTAWKTTTDDAVLNSETSELSVRGRASFFRVKCEAP